MILTTEQKSKASEIFEKGFESAAASLSFFLKDNVEISTMEIDSLKDPKEFDIRDFGERNAVCLVTDLIGDITGNCVLIFNEEDSLKFQEVCIGKPLESPADFEMGKALLLETDNIVTASVITEIANVLQAKMHGHVPSLVNVKKGELFDYLSRSSDDYTKALKITSHFESRDFSINPMFIWFFDENFKIHL